LALSTFTVANANDSGPGSLRQAILDADRDVGADTIAFAIGGGGAQTIALQSFLPPITDTVTVDGTTQPGFSGTPLIVLSGAAIQSMNPFIGIDVEADGCTVRGLALIHFASQSQNGPAGALVLGGNNNVISGNYIGLDANGLAASSFSAGGYTSGITVIGSNNVIGGTTAAARNVISDNFFGIGIGNFGGGGAGTIVEGNYIGSDPTGTKAIGSDVAIGVFNSPNVTIGGTAPGAGNLLVGPVQRQFSGIELSYTSDTVVAGNLFGTDATGTQSLGNTYLNPADMDINGGLRITIGGATSAARNVFANGTLSIKASYTLVQGNYMGTGIDGITPLGGPPALGLIVKTVTISGDNNVVANNVIANSPGEALDVISGTGNRISQNSIFASTALPIDLGDNGYTANGSKGHTGPNNYQNFPVITSTSTAGGLTTVMGALSSTAATTFTLEFFAGDQEPSGYVEGKTFLGAMPVTTDASGRASFTFTGPASSGPLFTATATDPAGNTSEFWQPDRPAPQITSINPSVILETAYGPIVTVNGANFFTTSTVQSNGRAVLTAYVSPTQLQAYVYALIGLPDTNLDEGPVALTVVNPGPGGGTSNAVTLPIRPALLPDGTRGTPNQRFVSELYEDLLHRAVDAPGLAHWSGLLDQGTPRQQIASAIESSTEYRIIEVQAVYMHYLRRSADAQGQAGFVSVLQHGGKVEQVIALVAGSPEYYQRAGGTINGFLQAIYADVLNRAPDTNSLAAFSNAMAAGLSPMAVVSFMAASQEYQQNLVRSYYMQYLERPADSSGLNAFANQLQHGTLDEDVIAEIVAALEYFNKTVA
jgi:hypothetical protein